MEVSDSLKNVQMNKYCKNSTFYHCFTYYTATKYINATKINMIIYYGATSSIITYVPDTTVAWGIKIKQNVCPAMFRTNAPEIAGHTFEDRTTPSTSSINYITHSLHTVFSHFRCIYILDRK